MKKTKILTVIMSLVMAFTAIGIADYSFVIGTAESVDSGNSIEESSTDGEGDNENEGSQETEQTTYNIKYIGFGGNIITYTDTNSDITYEYSSKTESITMPTLYEAGYKLESWWCTNSSVNIVKDNNIACLTNITGDLVFFSQWKKDEYVCKVNDNRYKTIQEAINAIIAGDNTEKEIVVTSDVTGNVEIPTDQTITLNLNGKVITGNVTSSGTLTIKGADEGYPGCIYGTLSINNNGEAIIIKNESNLNSLQAVQKLFTVPADSTIMENSKKNYYVHKHIFIENKAEEATCTEDGNEVYYTCSVNGCENKYYSVEFSNEKDVTSVTELDGIPTKSAKGHELTKIDAKAATCTEAGNIEYWYCNNCKEYFSDEALTDEITQEKTVIAATGHTAITDEAVAATCTSTGLTEGSHCLVCGEVIKAQEEVPATGHKLEKTEAKEATCTEDGNIEYWYCPDCGKYFSDEALTDEITQEKTVIAATGHTAVTDEAVAPSCEKTGLTEGSHCKICGTVINTRTIIPQLNHKLVKDKAVAATCTKDGKTVGIHCSVCNKVILPQETVKATGHRYKDGVCTICGVKDPNIVIKNLRKCKVTLSKNKKTLRVKVGNKASGKKYIIAITNKKGKILDKLKSKVKKNNKNKLIVDYKVKKSGTYYVQIYEKTSTKTNAIKNIQCVGAFKVQKGKVTGQKG